MDFSTKRCVILFAVIGAGRAGSCASDSKRQITDESVHYMECDGTHWDTFKSSLNIAATDIFGVAGQIRLQNEIYEIEQIFFCLIRSQSYFATVYFPICASQSHLIMRLTKKDLKDYCYHGEGRHVVQWTFFFNHLCQKFGNFFSFKLKF